MVGGGGLEPPLPFGRQYLKLVCLPIPPSSQGIREAFMLGFEPKLWGDQRYHSKHFPYYCSVLIFSSLVFCKFFVII